MEYNLKINWKNHVQNPTNSRQYNAKTEKNSSTVNMVRK